MSADRDAPKIVLGPIVRSTGPTWTSFWIQLDQRCSVAAELEPHHPKPKAATVLRSEPVLTVEVSGRHFALLRVEELQPSTLYDYALFAVTIAEGESVPSASADHRKHKRRKQLDLSARVYSRVTTVRTFAESDEDLRVAFGSCRAAEGGEGKAFGTDALEVYARSLADTQAERITSWPTLLLMLGDQIYGDNVSQAVIKARTEDGGPRTRPRSLGTVRKAGETNERMKGFHLGEFDDFATAYEVSFRQVDVAKMLAHVPTFMTGDDHEITDDWNITAGWREQALEDDEWLQIIANGLAAYWLYQAWGNPRASNDADKTVAVLDKAREDQVDAYDELELHMRRRLVKRNEGSLRLYFRIDTDPKVIVLDTRLGRLLHAPAVGDSPRVWADERDRIIDEEQRAWFKQEISGTRVTVLASSVPLLQTIPIDFGLLAMARPEQSGVWSLERYSQETADAFENVRRELDTDTWCAFPGSFREVIDDLLGMQTVVWLAGDVHYSYVHEGRVAGGFHLIHAVSSGFRREMDADTFSKLTKLTDLDDSVYSKSEFLHFWGVQRGFEIDIPASVVAPLVEDDLRSTRLDMPPMIKLFGGEGQEGPYTVENNVGVLRIYSDLSRCTITWHGVSETLGSYDFRIGG